MVLCHIEDTRMGSYLSAEMQSVYPAALADETGTLYIYICV